MGRQPRLGLYFENSEIKRRLVFAAAKRGISTTAYCTQAIEEQLVRDGILGDSTEQKAFIAKVDKLREDSDSAENSTESDKEGRRRSK